MSAKWEMESTQEIDNARAALERAEANCRRQLSRGVDFKRFNQLKMEASALSAALGILNSFDGERR